MKYGQSLADHLEQKMDRRHIKMSESENAVISCLLNSDVYDEVSSEINGDDFSDQFLKRVFETISIMIVEKLPIDAITVSSFIKKEFYEIENDILIRLFEISAMTCSSKNIKTYVENVKKESNKNKLKKLLNSTFEKINNGDDDYLDHVRIGISEIENNIPDKIVSYSNILEETIDEIEENSKNPNMLSGLSTGFKNIDDYTNGLQNGSMTILAAQPSKGKTMLMLNIADNIGCVQKLPVIIFSLEMPYNQLCKRSLSRFCNINSELIFKNKMTPNEWQKCSDGINMLSSSKVFINDKSAINIFQMRSYAKKIRNQNGLSAIFVDYLGLMNGDGENETLRLGNISKGLKSLARDLNIPVFVLCQLNRDVSKRFDKKPVLSDIRGSGNIEQDADTVMFLYNDENSFHMLNIAKNRNGACGEIRIIPNFNYFEFKECGSF